MNEKTKEVALAGFSYFRMVVVIASLIAWSEREWVGFFLSLGIFYLTTLLISKAIDVPSDETINALTDSIIDLAQSSVASQDES